VGILAASFCKQTYNPSMELCKTTSAKRHLAALRCLYKEHLPRKTIGGHTCGKLLQADLQPIDGTL